MDENKNQAKRKMFLILQDPSEDVAASRQFRSMASDFRQPIDRYFPVGIFPHPSRIKLHRFFRGFTKKAANFRVL